MITLPAVLLALAAAAPPPAPPRGETAVRAELDGLQRAVETAVAEVSRPAGLLVGATARSYHVKGFGAMVVLAPRLLPRAPRAAGAVESRVRADIARALEARHRAATDPEERRRLRRALEALRGEGGGDPQVHIVRRPPPQPLPPGEVNVLLEDAEAFRREAEAAMARAEREVLVRLRVPAPPETPAPPGVPAALLPPEPPVVPPPAAVPDPALPPTPAHPPAPPFVFSFPPGMPFVFADDGPDEVAPERVLADVRGAIARGLAAHRGRLAHLAADEVVAVAIDFVPRMADRTAARTVVARAKKRDLLEARAGRLTAAALEKRIAFDEY